MYPLVYLPLSPRPWPRQAPRQLESSRSAPTRRAAQSVECHAYPVVIGLPCPFDFNARAFTFLGPAPASAPARQSSRHRRLIPHAHVRAKCGRPGAVSLGVVGHLCAKSGHA